MPTIQGTPVATGPTTNATSATINLPSGIQAGELLLVYAHTSEASRSLILSGFTEFFAEGYPNGLETQGNLLYKIATGSEGATINGSFTAGGSAQASTVAWRMTGFDPDDIFNSLNFVAGEAASSDPFVLAADLLTDVAAGSDIFLVFGAQAARTVTSGDSDLDLVGQQNTSNLVAYVYRENAPGSSNKAYSIDMSSTYAWGWALFEVKAAPAEEDETPPTLTNASGTKTGTTTADLSVDVDEEADVYVVVTESETTPSAEQIEAGQDHTGASATFADSELGASAGTVPFSATGLDPETTYYAHFWAEDAAENSATPITSASFTTDAEAAVVNITPFVIGVNFGTTFGVSREIEPFKIGVRFNAPTVETPGQSSITPFGIGVRFIAPSPQPIVTIEPFVIGISLRSLGIQIPEGGSGDGGLTTLNTLTHLTTVVR